jgi:uroporphyrinogen-III synthase
MSHASFDGLKVLSLESRRAKEVEKLIRTYRGEPIVVPAMREVGLESHAAALDFLANLLKGEFDLVIFMTGVGVRALMDIARTQYDTAAVVEALRKVLVVARGPKPEQVLRDLKVPVMATAPEPSTWRELLVMLDAVFGPSLSTMRVALQEYGASNPELLSALSERCLSVTKVPVYQWALPVDLQPLRECVMGITTGYVDVVLFMTAVQVIHLFQVAEQMGVEQGLRAGLSSMVVLSIGPTTTEELTHYGLIPDFEPSRPKMGFLVNEAAQYAGQLLKTKRDSAVANLEGIATTTGDGSVPKLPVRRVAESTSTMAGFRDGLLPMEFLHELSSRIASSDPFHEVLMRVVDFVTLMVPCDSCFIYVLEDDKLVLRASKNPHTDVVDRLGLQVGQGITGWAAQHREPVAIDAKASDDPRFSPFINLPEDRFEAILCTPVLCAGRVVGVITVQHRLPYRHTTTEVRLLSTIGYLIGAEVERARLETENLQLSDRLETRKLLDRAKSVLQRSFHLTEDEAYRRMQRESRQRRKAMREIAEAILLTEDLARSQNDATVTTPQDA